MWKRLVISLLMMVALDAQKADPLAYITKEVEAFMKEHQLVGIAVGFYCKGVPYFLNFGRANGQTKVTEHTIFEIGSITKSFTATILAYEVVKGSMKLNDPVSRYLPFVRRHPSALSRVTLEQLATHTSSLPRDPVGGWMRATKHKMLQSLQQWQPDYPIGTHYRYSNLGFDILGFALENHCHKGYDMMLQDLVTGPLGMKNTHIHTAPRLNRIYAQGHNKKGMPVHHLRANAIEGAGALRSTTEDMMKFLMANLDVSGPPMLRKAMRLAQKGRFKAPKMIQALSWQRVTRQGVEFIDKNGGVGGFSSWMGMVPDKKTGLILLSNMRCGKLTTLGRTLLITISKETA